jgi:hypothetical protein
MQEMPRLSEELDGWLSSDRPKTLGSLVELFQERSFAVLFVLLLAVSALPLPTGGVTHVLELIAMFLALQLIAGRQTVWLPERLKVRELGSATQTRFRQTLLKRIRWLEGHSRPRLRFLLGHRPSMVIFGVVVLGLSLGAFLAPPFTGLDTLPSLGVVVISVGVLLDDAVLVLAGLVIGVAGVILEVVLGSAAYHGLSSLL